MELQETGIPGCLLIRPRVIGDERGCFAKTFHVGEFEVRALRTDWREEYHSASRAGVIRGMHFQMPPADHAKLVYCLAGDVLDVIVDLRRGSPTFGEHRAIPLDGAASEGLYVPTGCAHGFLSRSAESLMLYKVTSVHAPAEDRGIAWNSFSFDWPVQVPILSERDRAHPALREFDSPFAFDAEKPTR